MPARLDLTRECAPVDAQRNMSSSRHSAYLARPAHARQSQCKPARAPRERYADRAVDGGLRCTLTRGSWRAERGDSTDRLSADELVWCARAGGFFGTAMMLLGAVA